MSTLTNYESEGNRSFGNELFQYAALKIYAKKYDLTVEVPDGWVGRQLFKCDDPVISDRHRQFRDLGASKECIWNNSGLIDCDIKGYFQYHTSVYAEYKDYFKELFALYRRIRKENTAKKTAG